jgi:hypothetical protein
MGAVTGRRAARCAAAAWAHAPTLGRWPLPTALAVDATGKAVTRLSRKSADFVPIDERRVAG